MKFTIIIPVYNAERYLQRCLDSLSRQTFKDFEVIAVNDGSTDDSLAILNQATCDGGGNKLNISVINKQNQGVSSARNTGLDNASGDWILFMDSDDYLASSSLEKYNKFLVENPASELIVSNYLILRSNRCFRVKFKSYNNLNIVKAVDELDYTYNNSLAFLWHKIYRREIIEQTKLRFDTDFSFGEDSLFNIKYLSQIKEVSFINADTYRYCDDNPNSLVKQKYPVETTLRLLKKYLGQLDSSSNIGVINYSVRLLFRSLVMNEGRIGKSELSILIPSIKEIIPYISDKQRLEVTDMLIMLTNSFPHNEAFDRMKAFLKKDAQKHLLTDIYARTRDKLYNSFFCKRNYF